MGKLTIEVQESKDRYLLYKYRTSKDPKNEEKIELVLRFKTKDTKREDVIETVDNYSRFDLDEIEKTIKNFLESKTVENRAKLVRQPDRVKPLMTLFYGGEKIAAEGFDRLNRTQVSYQRNLLTAQVGTADYLSYPIAVERIEEGESASYLVDWESWVGFCDLKPKEMQAKLPTTPITMRAVISRGDYFNYGFADENEWRSYKLELRNSEIVFYGYSKRGSAAAKALANSQKEDAREPYLIKVAYPEKAKSKNQVEIVEVITDGWITKEAEKKKQD